MSKPVNEIDTYASNERDDASEVGERPAEADPLLSAPILAALERAWATIRARHGDLPPVVMVLASGSDGAPAGWLKLGHFAAMRWQTGQSRDDVMPEVFIGGEGLARGAHAVLGTLLHEAAHALAHARGVKDTSRQGRYHNQRYANLARGLGLDVAQIAPIGWSHTTLTPATAIDYRATLDDLTQALTIFRRSEADLFATTTGADDDNEDGELGAGGDATRSPRLPAGPTRPSRSLAAVCGCGRRIRLARSVFEAGAITCALCRAPFAAVTNPQT